MKKTLIVVAFSAISFSHLACKTNKSSDSEVKTLSRPYTTADNVRNGDSTKYTILYSKVGQDIVVEACNNLAANNKIANSQNCDIEMGTFTAQQIADYKSDKLGGKALPALYIEKKSWEDQVAISTADMEANPTIKAFEQQKAEDVANLQAVMNRIQPIEAKIASVDKAIALMADSGLKASSKDRDFFGSDEPVIIDFLQYVFDTVN